MRPCAGDADSASGVGVIGNELEACSLHKDMPPRMLYLGDITTLARIKTFVFFGYEPFEGGDGIAEYGKAGFCHEGRVMHCF